MVDIHSEEYILGQNIRKYRLRLGWSQADLSNAVDIDRADISKYENGAKGIMSSSLLRKFAKALAKLTAYENGYAVYEVDSAHTVMAVECCGDYRYDFTDGTHQIVPAETFEDAEWSLRLLMEGEKRMEHNLSKTAAKFEQVPLECDGSDWSTSIMVDFLDADNAEMLADRELRRLYAAMNKLTERQMEVVQLYFYKGMTQQEIAEEIGIGRRSGGNCLEGALKKIRKNF